jgi:hypothetical protein
MIRGYPTRLLRFARNDEGRFARNDEGRRLMIRGYPTRLLRFARNDEGRIARNDEGGSRVRLLQHVKQTCPVPSTLTT